MENHLVQQIVFYYFYFVSVIFPFFRFHWMLFGLPLLLFELIHFIYIYVYNILCHEHFLCEIYFSHGVFFNFMGKQQAGLRRNEDSDVVEMGIKPCPVGRDGHHRPNGLLAT
jgi:hypothetical protein